MNVIQDLVSMASDISDNAKNIKDKKITVRPAIRSISSYAAKDTYYFPVLCSREVSPDTASMVTRNLERVYSSFIRACFAMMPAIHIDNADEANVETYLRRFHQNIGIDAGGELSFKLESVELMKEWKMFPNEILNEASLQNVADLMNDVKKNINNDGSFNDYVSMDADDETKEQKNTFKSYKETDYKKANEMMPSFILATVNFFIDNGGAKNQMAVTIPVGIKTQLHTLNADELDNQLMDSIAGKGLLHSLIRWSTGEMLSLKDILFGVDRFKKNITNKDSDVRMWFDALERRKRLSSLSAPVLNRKAFLPNISLVISKHEEERIKQEVGYSLLDPKVASRFMKENFLLTLVIADDLLETLYVMYDGHNSFEEYTYATVERENAKHDKEMSTLIKTIGKLV